MYRHAQDHRLLSWGMVGYPSLFGNILGVSTGQFLSCRGSRIAPCNSMNVTFLVHADNAVYQICTYAVKSQDMTNMQKYAPHFADGALPLQVGVGLTPRRRRLFAVAPSVPGPRLWRAVFSQHWTKIRPICLPRRNCACIDTLRTTGYYPGISWVIPVYLVISLLNP